MTDDTNQLEKQSEKHSEPILPIHWQRVQSAIWLIGLAILAWRGWWWPGILVLVAISGLFQAGVQYYLGQQTEQKVINNQEKELAQGRANWLPTVCPNCGGPLSVSTVKWTGPNTAACPYCSSHLKPAS